MKKENKILKIPLSILDSSKMNGNYLLKFITLYEIDNRETPQKLLLPIEYKSDMYYYSLTTTRKDGMYFRDIKVDFF